MIRIRPTPEVGMAVHYRSYGTPDGEYVPRCRAAIITEVGAWLDDVVEERVDAAGLRRRTVEQTFRDDACSIRVLNPTGDFFNVCAYDRRYADEPWPNGGRWHAPSECR